MAQFAFLYRGGDPMPDSPEEKQKRLQRWLRWFEDLKADHLRERRDHLAYGRPSR